ncbi:hypothetical protein PAEPH01_0306 [Pancytospora epiphaga]|nr:hypothetical protein PAEPH01_0306 [Pancytospora epiphaga]
MQLRLCAAFVGFLNFVLCKIVWTNGRLMDNGKGKLAELKLDDEKEERKIQLIRNSKSKMDGDVEVEESQTLKGETDEYMLPDSLKKGFYYAFRIPGTKDTTESYYYSSKGTWMDEKTDSEEIERDKKKTNKF